MLAITKSQTLLNWRRYNNIKTKTRRWLFLTRQTVERSDRRRRDCTTPITFWRAKTSLTDDFSILFLFFIHFIYDLQLLPASVRSFCAKFGAMVGRHFDKLITAAKNVIGNSNVAFAIGRSRARCHLLVQCEHNVSGLDNLQMGGAMKNCRVALSCGTSSLLISKKE